MKRTIIIVSTIIFLTSIGFSNPVPSLPSDNLIDFDSAWMRDSNKTPSDWGYPAGYGQWADETGNMGLSRGANKNPSPDNLDGTAMQMDAGVMTADPLPPNTSAYVHLFVDAPLPHDSLKFSQWRILRNGGNVDVTVYGCDSDRDNCVMVWTPVSDAPSGINWEQTGIRQTAVSVAYPVYKIRQHCMYGSGNAGCKFTGYYFSVTNGGNPLPTSTPNATAVPAPTPEPTSSGWPPPEWCEQHPEFRMCNG